MSTSNSAKRLFCYNIKFPIHLIVSILELTVLDHYYLYKFPKPLSSYRRPPPLYFLKPKLSQALQKLQKWTWNLNASVNLCKKLIFRKLKLHIRMLSFYLRNTCGIFLCFTLKINLYSPPTHLPFSRLKMLINLWLIPSMTWPGFISHSA